MRLRCEERTRGRICYRCFLAPTELCVTCPDHFSFSHPLRLWRSQNVRLGRVHVRGYAMLLFLWWRCQTSLDMTETETPPTKLVDYHNTITPARTSPMCFDARAVAPLPLPAALVMATKIQSERQQKTNFVSARTASGTHRRAEEKKNPTPQTNAGVDSKVNHHPNAPFLEAS